MSEKKLSFSLFFFISKVVDLITDLLLLIFFFRNLWGKCSDLFVKMSVVQGEEGSIVREKGVVERFTKTESYRIIGVNSSLLWCLAPGGIRGDKK